MTSMIVALRLLAASQVLLFGCALGLSKNPWPIRTLGAMLALAVIGYLIVPLTQSLPGPVHLAMVTAANAIPFVLLLFVWVLFEDERPLPWPVLLLGIVYLAGSAASRGLGVTDDVGLLAITIQILKLAFAGAAIAIVWRGREADLVEERLKLRRLFTAGTGVAVVAVVIAELVTVWQVPALLELFGMAGMLLLALAINLAFLHLNPTFVLTGRRAAKLQPNVSDPLLGALIRLMTEERVYADHDLRVASLASRLNVPEHRLRRAINQQLGYRNFNQFVNAYRIEEAARRLESEPRSPILTIALDVGFRSISSFNAAFRTAYHLSPSQFRAQLRTES